MRDDHSSPETATLASAGPPPSPVPPPGAVDAAPAPDCANCGTGLAGPYCWHCGQHVADYHRSVWRFLSDFLDNTFCWDNKFLRTLTPLVRQPGFLTQEFMAGRRVQYVHPLRLFLFTSAVCLTLVGLIPHSPAKFSPRHRAKDGKIEYVAPAAKAAAADNTDDDDEQDEAPSPGPVPVATAAPLIPAAAAEPAATGPSFGQKLQQLLATNAPKAAGATPALPVPTIAPVPTPTVPALEKSGKLRLGAEIRRALRENGVAPAAGSPAAAASADPGAEAYEKRINKVIDQGISLAEAATAEQQRAKKAGEMAKMISGSAQAGKMVEATLEGIKARLSWVGLALLPVFALFLRAVYWREDSYYFAHLVFSLHYHAFLFVFWVTWASLDFVLAHAPLSGLWGFLLGCSLLLPGWYLFRALRRMYHDSPRRTAVKVLLLGSLHLLSILIGVASVGALAFFSAQQ